MVEVPVIDKLLPARSYVQDCEVPFCVVTCHDSKVTECPAGKKPPGLLAHVQEARAQFEVLRFPAHIIDVVMRPYKSSHRPAIVSG